MTLYLFHNRFDLRTSLGTFWVANASNQALNKKMSIRSSVTKAVLSVILTFINFRNINRASGSFISFYSTLWFFTLDPFLLSPSLFLNNPLHSPKNISELLEEWENKSIKLLLRINENCWSQCCAPKLFPLKGSWEETFWYFDKAFSIGKFSFRENINSA